MKKFCLITGLVNNILWLAFTLAIYPLPIPPEITIQIAEFTHEYLGFYFYYKIAFIFASISIIFLVSMLIKKNISIIYSIILFILNTFWMPIYVLAYLN